MSDKVKFDICYFKVPVTITKVEEGDEVEFQATFKEVDMTDICYKLETHETSSNQEAIALGQTVATANEQTLKIASRIKKDGDLVTRKVLCKHGSVRITENKNN